MQATLTERAQALAAEAIAERERLEARRRTLAVERDEEVEAIRQRHAEAARAEVEQARERHAATIAEVDAELATIRRLARAVEMLDPDRPKPGPKAKPKAGSGAGQSNPVPRWKQWRPSQPTLNRILAAVADGATTVPLIDDAVPVSRATVDIALNHLRNDGLVRLAGQTGGRGSSRMYRTTPEGDRHMATVRERNGVVANA